MTNFLIPITVNQLPAVSELEGRQGMFILPDGSININRQDGTWMIINKQSDHAGVLKTTDTVSVQPGVAKWYWAGPGTYNNAGGKIIQKYGIISYTGSTWQSLEIELPQARIDTWSAAAYPTGKQIFHEGKIYELTEPATAADVPGVSLKWVKKTGSNALAVFDPTDNINPSTMKAIAERYDNLVTALGDFAIPTGDQNLKTYNWDDNDQVLFGKTPSSALLKANNTIQQYSEAGLTPRTWINIPCTGFNKIIISLYRTGGSSSAPVYVNMIGAKSDGSTNILIAPNSDPASGIYEIVTVDLTNYVSVSININHIDAYTNKPKIEFLKAGGILENNAVIKYINSHVGVPAAIDLIKFGCIGDGITDDTDKFNQAIAKAMELGIDVYGGSRAYKVSYLTIPNTQVWKKLEIFGDRMPVPTYGTIGSVSYYASIQKGMRIISTYNGGVQNIGVVTVAPGGTGSFDNFNFLTLVLRDMVITTYDNPKLSGVQAYNAQQLIMHDVLVDTGVYNVQSLEPTYDTGGVITPHNSNAAKNVLRNVMVSGYSTGISVHEHTDGDDIAIHSCKHGLRFRRSDHASFFTRVLSQRNQNVVTVDVPEADKICRFQIGQLNCEYVGTGQFNASNAWQKTQYELNDPQNKAQGNITYANVRGEFGAIDTFRMNGGTGVIVKRIGSETRLTGAGIIDPNTIN